MASKKHATTSSSGVQTDKAPKPQKFKCPRCDFSTGFSATFQHHQRSAHASVERVDTKAKTYFCPLCNVKATDKTTFRLHLEGRQHLRQLRGQESMDFIFRHNNNPQAMLKKADVLAARKLLNEASSSGALAQDPNPSQSTPTGDAALKTSPLKTSPSAGVSSPSQEPPQAERVVAAEPVVVKKKKYRAMVPDDLEFDLQAISASQIRIPDPTAGAQARPSKKTLKKERRAAQTSASNAGGHTGLNQAELGASRSSLAPPTPAAATFAGRGSGSGTSSRPSTPLWAPTRLRTRKEESAAARAAVLGGSVGAMASRQATAPTKAQAVKEASQRAASPRLPALQPSGPQDIFSAWSSAPKATASLKEADAPLDGPLANEQPSDPDAEEATLLDEGTATAEGPKMNSQSLHDLLDCPITLETMADPVTLTDDGHTYERSAIEEWLSRNETSPMTNEPLVEKSLVPNLALKKLIDQLEASLEGFVL